MAIETGMFAANTGGATTTVSTGFQYKGIILYCFGDSTSFAERANALMSIGFSDGTNVWNDVGAYTDNVTNNGETRATSATVLLRIPTNDATLATATINSVAFNSGNFVVTFSGTPGAAYEIGYIGFGGADITNAFVGQTTSVSTPPKTITVSGVGFQGDIVFLLNAAQFALDTSSNAMVVSFGCAVSSSKQWSQSIATGGNTSGQLVASYSDNANAYLAMLGSGSTPSIIAKGSFASWTSDGFTISETVEIGANTHFGYLILKGGAWDCGLSTKPTTATTQTVTGSSFQPTFVGLVLAGATANQTFNGEIDFSIGGMTSTVQNFAGCFSNNVFNSVCKSNGSNTVCIGERTGSSTWNAADYSSFNSDGWTVSWSATGSAFLVGWFSFGTAAPAGDTIAIATQLNLSIH